MAIHETKQRAVPSGIERLQSGLLDGTYTCRQLIERQIERIERMNPALNAIVVPTFRQALEQADEIDRKLAGGQPVGPLFGVPVTVKECLDMNGTAATWGLPGRTGRIAEADDPLVAKLRQADAIIMGKTNIQQLLLGSECVNPVYGRTNHPLRPDRTPGGSSGGEGAAVAAGLSVIGIGTDAGGSVRIPAHFCGVHALKPAPGKLIMNPPEGIHTVHGEVGAIIAAPGILAGSVADLASSYNVLAGASVRIDTESVKRMKLGYFIDDGIIEPSASIKRLLHETVDCLRQQGIEVEPIELPRLEDISRAYFALVMNGAKEGYARTIGTNIVIPKISGIVKLLSMPRLARRLLGSALRIMKQRRTANLVFKALEPALLPDLLQQREQLKQQIVAYLQERHIDAVLCPPYPTPALKHDGATDMSVEGVYAQLFNYIGFPAGVVSLSEVREGEVRLRRSDGDKVVEAANRTDEGSEGLPIGVQVASLPGHEDKLLSVMAVLEERVADR